MDRRARLGVRISGHLAWLAALLLSAACSSPEGDAPPAREEPRLLVEVQGERIRLVARDVSQRRLLEQLSFQFFFALELAALEDRSVTLRLEDASLSEALAAVLAGTAYSLEYAYDADLGSHRLRALRVGAFRETPLAAEPAPPPRERPEPSPGEPPTPSPRERLRAREPERTPEERSSSSLLARLRESQDEASEQLRDPNPELRANAVFEFDSEGPQGLEPVIELAYTDPAPQVRAAAAEALGHYGSAQAKAALVEILEDPDPEVVVAAVHGLEFSGDASHVEALEPLTTHRDDQVREAAEMAIDFLR